MAKLSVLDMKGKKVSDIELNDGIFAIEPNMSAMHLVVVNYLANQRQGTQSTLTRSEVSGGGKKPWRQKGTGRARQGSTRAPQWYHGGIALGPKPRDYGFSINKKVRRLAMKSALSSKVAADEMIVLDSLTLDAIKTKDVVAVLSAIGAGKKTLIVLPEKNDVIYKSARNIAGVKTTLVSTLNVYDILNCDKIVVLKDAASKIEEVYA
ncbi:MAG: 50S ribosomal protein L4 [Oscillospiraceae bacterium]|nr:50S ribosomal protein L4 [Oscillospiraceae bacterium]